MGGTDEIHDYSRKGGVADAFTMAPKDAPDWVHDREQLWTEVELGEKRKDAQLAREYNVAFPIELSQEQTTEMLRDYVQRKRWRSRQENHLDRQRKQSTLLNPSVLKLCEYLEPKARAFVL